MESIHIHLFSQYGRAHLFSIGQTVVISQQKRIFNEKNIRIAQQRPSLFVDAYKVQSAKLGAFAIRIGPSFLQSAKLRAFAPN